MERFGSRAAPPLPAEEAEGGLFGHWGHSRRRGDGCRLRERQGEPAVGADGLHAGQAGVGGEPQAAAVIERTLQKPRLAERRWLLGRTRYARSNPPPDQRRKFVDDCSVQFE